MANVEFFDDFIGAAVAFPTSANIATPWVITETSAGGAPTYVRGVDDGGGGGIARLQFAADNEVENICLSFGNTLTFDIDDGLIWESRIRLGQAALDTTTSLAFGLAGDRNDTLDSVAQHCWFRMEGGTSTTLVVCESDDGTTDNDDIATGLTLTTGWKTFRISMSPPVASKSNIQFSMSDAAGVLTRVAPGTTFSMAAYSSALQPIFQIQKTADTNTDYIDIDYVKIRRTLNS